MRTIRQMGIFGGVLLSSALLCMGCLSEVSGGEKTNQDSFASKAVTPKDDTWSKPSLPPPCPFTSGKLGDGVSCEDLSVLQQEAADACAAAGLSVAYIKVWGDCADGLSTGGDFGCEPPTGQPPPGPDSCTVGKVGDGLTCQDTSMLEQQAMDACAAEGRSFSGLKVPGDCAGGQSTLGNYLCCLP